MNKDVKTKEYLKKMGSLKLSESSRSRIKNNLLAYARFHGVRARGDSRSMKQVPQRTSLLNAFKQPKSMTAAIIAVTLVVGGGTSYAAEGAVPGDFLYTVKTEVNENVKSAFAIGNEAEAKLQARLVEERLEEAEALAARGELTAGASADMSSRIKAHHNEAEEHNAQVEAKGDFESSAAVRSSLEGVLRAHAGVLTDLNARVSGNNGSSLINDIRTYADATARAQTQATATIKTSADMQAMAEATVERAETVITQVESKLTRAKARLSAEAHARAEAKFNEAVSALAEANASLRTEAYRVAYSAAHTAIRIASEAGTVIDSLLRIQVDVPLDTDTILDVDMDTSADNEAQTGSDTRTESTESADENSDNSSTDVERDATSDTSVDTDVIDAETETDASLRSELNL